MATVGGSNVYDFVDHDILPGDRVRAYQAAPPIDSYVEGVVQQVTGPIDGHCRYQVLVDFEVKFGRRVDLPYPPHVGPYLVYPRVNGSPSCFSRGLGMGVVPLQRSVNIERPQNRSESCR